MPTRRAIAAAAFLAAALLEGAPGTARAQSGPAKGTASPKPAVPALEDKGLPLPRFDVGNGACKDFLALPSDLRGLVVAWTAGRYHKLRRWVLDEATARSVIAGVEDRCDRAPDASFRYQGVAEIDTLKK